MRLRSTLLSVVSLVVAIAFIAISRYNKPDTPGIVFPLSAAIIAVTVIGAQLYKLRTHRRLIENYIITMDEHGITRQQQGFAPLTISYSGIMNIVQFKGGLVVKGIDPADQITIPTALEDYEAVAKELETIMPFSQAEKPGLKRFIPFVLMLIILGLFLVFSREEHTDTGTIAGVLLLPMLVWSLVYIRRRNRHSWVSFFALLILTLSVAISLLHRLTGISLL